MVLPVSKASELVYKPRGAVKRLWTERPTKCLVEGPAGTGKSRGVGEYLYDLMTDPALPPIRAAVLRQTRRSLTQSWLVTWETKILPQDSPLLEGPGRRNRESYVVPGKGSELFVAGMDEPSRLWSTEFDVIYINEGLEVAEWDVNNLDRALRNGKLPWPEQLIIDTNPGAPLHWLNTAANRGDLLRLVTTHKDNPEYWSDELNDWTPLGRRYVLGKLAKLPGVLGDRMYRGLWKAAEGQVLDNFDPEIHYIDAEDLPIMRWTAGSMDFGYRNPGCLGVWGFDSDNNAYLLAQVYKRHWSLDMWADALCELHQQYDMRAVVCDAAEPRSIDFLNDRLGALGGRSTDPICIKADKSRGKLFGVDTLRTALEPPPAALDGTRPPPRMRLVRDNLRFGRDEGLDEEKRPCCWEEEIPVYTYVLPKSGVEPSRAARERVDDRCPNHGCDMAEYLAVWAWGRDYGESQVLERIQPGTMGWYTRHWEFLGEPPPENYLDPRRYTVDY